MREGDILAEVRLELQKHGVKTFRNNVGMLRDENGRFVRFGLCVGSSDTIGWYEHQVRPQDVGRKIAVFTAIETKMPKTGKLTKEQSNFIGQVQLAGGVAGVARVAQDAVRILKAWLCQSRGTP